jgi:hypothetical protein
LLDPWHATKRLQLTPGIRQDWDRRVVDAPYLLFITQ